MKKYNKDDVNYTIMCKFRQYLVKYVMRLMSLVLRENN